MRICDLHTGRIRLTRSMKQLRDQWSATREHWSDANQAQFEQEYLQPLAPQLTMLLSSVERLSEVLVQVERDCRDEEET